MISYLLGNDELFSKVTVAMDATIRHKCTCLQFPVTLFFTNTWCYQTFKFLLVWWVVCHYTLNLYFSDNEIENLFMYLQVFYLS